MMERTTFISVNNLNIDVARRQASLGDGALDLTPKEFDLLAFLAGNRGLVFSREQLLEKVWGYNYAGNTRTVDVHIRWLRKKIEADPGKPQRILTVGVSATSWRSKMFLNIRWRIILPFTLLVLVSTGVSGWLISRFTDNATIIIVAAMAS